MIGDLPDADCAPPENVLFVCKLNPVTTDDDLEIIFSRFGKVVSCEVIRDKKTQESLQYAFVEFEDQKACESAYFKMDNVLIDDRRIHVDFSQSVSKYRWKGKGRLEVFDDEKKENRKNNTTKSTKDIRDDHKRRSSRDRSPVKFKERKRSRSREHRKRDNRSRSREHHDRKRSRSRDRKRSRSRDRDRKRERRSRSREHNRKRSRSRDRYHHKHGNKHDRRRSRSRSRDRDRKRDQRDDSRDRKYRRY